MRLLTKNEYKQIENLLYEYGQNKDDKKYTECMKNAFKEIEEFFENSPPHLYFLHTYYFDRYKYKNRYPNNASLLKKICKDLYIEQPTGYIIKRELIYKIAIIFYKNKVIN